jgi:3-hydroxyisobutyrate dehydrogenase-like beta-hydroxyacid dehydrogenase
MTDASTVAALAKDSEIVLSICPPHAAKDVAAEVAGTASGFSGTYVDANAVAPATTREIGAIVESGGGRMVDGGIVGGPPEQAGTTRLYVSGEHVDEILAIFEGSALEVVPVGADVGRASALKMCYAAWTKGTSALLLGIRAVATSEGVDSDLLTEWERSQPSLPQRSNAAARAAHDKGWRWRGEMDEIAATFAAAGLPEGFHQAAADIYARSPRPDGTTGSAEPLEQMLTALLGPATAADRT